MPLILGTNSIKDTGYNVANSCRFDKTSDDTLNRTQSGAGNRKTWTFSTWIKICKRAGDRGIFSYYDDSNNFGKIGLQGDYNQLVVNSRTSGTYHSLLQTSNMLRDFSAWYNIIVAADTTQATEANRIKIYINGTQVTSFTSSTYPAQNHDLEFNTTDANYISNWNGSSQELDAYLAETVFIDGTALAPTNFGEFDEDSPTIWKPIDVSGLTFGTYGFYLDYEDSSALGNDVAGSNNFSVNNLTAIDQSTDTCTNNFATLNPLDTNASHTLSEGNLKAAYSASAGTFGITKGTMGVSAGKWYFEVKYTYGNAAQIGFFNVNDLDTTNTTDLFGDTSTFEGLAWRIDTNNNIKEVGTNQNADSGMDFSSGNILGVAFDADNGKFYGYNNGVEITGQDISAGTSLLTAVTVSNFFLPFVSGGDGGSGTKTNTAEFNFGSAPFSISSGNSDGKGHGNFEYAVPSGYFALCTKNLAENG